MIQNNTENTTNSLNKKTEAWSGRFNEPVAELVKRYTASVGFDKRLAEFDIQGSIAHAQMLGAQGIIAAQDVSAIEHGLAEILAEIQSGKFEWLLDLEDVHLNIEKRTSPVGALFRYATLFCPPYLAWPHRLRVENFFRPQV